jgi:hypothetical protein
MSLGRRRFLFAGVAGLAATTTSGLRAIASVLSAQPPAATVAATALTAAASPYGAGVRGQVFEVVVRQALGGAPWREICAGPMQVNNISPTEVEAEVIRRQKLVQMHPHHAKDASCMACQKEGMAAFLKTKAGEAETMAADHANHPGFFRICERCNEDWRNGRALRLNKDRDYEWVEPAPGT